MTDESWWEPETQLAAAVDAAIPDCAQREWDQHVAHEPVLIGRQGIFTNRLRPFAYQLSYRSPTLEPLVSGSWSEFQHERATAHVLRSTFGRTNFEDVSQGRWLFVRFPRAYLMGELPIPERPDRLVIEVAEHVEIDHQLIGSLRNLRDRGFRIAVPGFVSRPSQRLLLPHADFVKIDVRDLDVEGRPVVELARSYGALLIAEFVEHSWLLEHSCDLGFDLLQGNLLEPPTVLDRSAARIARRVA
ncbi:diguanylate phosphodiesterase [Cellulomonas sp. WB94]|uniref:EAL domain-containing protein n=1 Tax=Cellulomonas sp. WB94 TaxID=2173174 RepID=UPI000D58705A|nr:EAL domain-containing protein [Cellulomonas sp. WB94]PVU84263.1 diguanylate phosphodiesterase [Cellulomonas sp. WB94]